MFIWVMKIINIKREKMSYKKVRENYRREGKSLSFCLGVLVFIEEG